MPQLIEFVVNHWFLFSALVVVIGLLIYTQTIVDQQVVDPVAATEMINRRDAVVVDVRPAADFSQGHILNAINIPSNGFGQQLGILDKHRQTPIIVNCRSGAQSQLACEQLRKAGFAEVYNLRGGVMAWQAANLPLSRKKHKS